MKQTNKKHIPRLAVPVSIASDPLSPLIPEFALMIKTFPLDVWVPNPLVRETAPPDCAVDDPADMIKAPPTAADP